MSQLRYILFVGEHYYPAGGARDLQGFYADLEETKTAVDPERRYAVLGVPRWEVSAQWAHIFDAQTDTIVASWDEGDGWVSPPWWETE